MEGNELESLAGLLPRGEDGIPAFAGAAARQVGDALIGSDEVIRRSLSPSLLRGQPPGGWRNCREPEALRPNSFLLCQQVRHWCGVFKQDVSFQPGGPHCLYLSLQFLS